MTDKKMESTVNTTLSILRMAAELLAPAALLALACRVRKLERNEDDLIRLSEQIVSNIDTLMRIDDDRTTYGW